MVANGDFEFLASLRIFNGNYFTSEVNVDGWVCLDNQSSFVIELIQQKCQSEKARSRDTT